MTPAESRVLVALLIGPMTRQQVAKALNHSPSWADRSIRSLIQSHHIIRLATPTFTGKMTWRNALTQRGTIAAQQRIQS